MGRKTVKLVASAHLSAHNDEQDDADRQQWEQFIAAVRQLAQNPEYDIDIDVWET